MTQGRQLMKFMVHQLYTQNQKIHIQRKTSPTHTHTHVQAQPINFMAYQISKTNQVEETYTHGNL